MRILSWNVNGIRAVSTKGFFEWLTASGADVVCLQETKARPEQLTKDFFEVPDSSGQIYHSHFSSAKRPGYSGVAIYSRQEPLSVQRLGIEEFDDEGRYLEAEYRDLTVISAYFPNSQDAGARIDYKIRFCEAALARMDELVKAGRRIVLCGDYNIAHCPIDLARPEANEQNPGYLPEERAFMGRFLAAGYVDTFRYLYPEAADRYSWWSYRMRAREKNVGWRIDYACINQTFLPALRSADIHDAVTGSDHCPVSVELAL
ncbi:MAG: exodeoxyribonuclease III [Spirochaetes bacterium GWD1_61_31]|nr:MAG: exodeoxyribonuclease III [Spirochaetes bacterium GWB1_60_80]OHD31699.1 MAG: exodeoxyribonuclease III [Spirochaetes bacterium GWC1_61_12]OHD36241.1 MAG: exodeoxyribonuclease III [Spirochaetes bacterium GWD1_61_31]OHD41496.1 MAG: exodeoxyribonuclease III [Spirochaetes bacterium GWE1_60_18]OHD61398.1 MAG: exodeoxyribonuclease III [Spirochaetes bacterium GWF1_60_12]HAP44529.1 exodeoxyribonuclease III [Spirochaetaceae bacterium]